MRQQTKILANADKDKSEKRRLESNMSYYLQQSGDMPKGTRLSGDARRKFLLLYLAKQAKDKNATSTSSSSREVVIDAINRTTKRWWSKEKMIKELGEKKALGWIGSGKLETRADAVTGSMEEDMMEYNVPEDMESTTNHDTNRAKINVDVTISKENQEGALEDLSDMAANLINGLKEPKVKTEPTDDDPKTIAKQAVLALQVVKDAKSVLHRLRDVEMDCRLLKDAQSDSSYTEKVKEDAGKLLPKLGKVIKAVESMMGKLDPDTLNFKEVHRLEASVEEVVKQFEVLREWGIKLGLCAPSRAAKRMKKT